LQVIEAVSDTNDSDDRFFDVRAEQVAKVYARALVDAAQKSGQTEAIVAELDSFVTDVLDKLPLLKSVLGAAMRQPEQKLKLIDQVFQGRASPLFLSFVKTLARHGRLDIVRTIRHEVHKLHDELRHLVRVDVQTAAPLPAELKQTMAQMIQARTGGTPVLVERIEPELIAGFVVRVGDTVFDGSVATNLAKLHQKMIDRSVHEIQSRRDRLSSPEGN
jgi:F-type H+-transporting ATPase subunit delta